MDEQSSVPPNNPSPAAQPSNETLMGVLAYLSILVIIPLLTAKNDPFVKFHIKQGLVLLIIEVIAWFLSGLLWQFWEIFQLINLCVVILSIIGIVNVVNHKQTELPLVGSLAKNFGF
jgi:uncharacterized membrane protein